MTAPNLRTQSKIVRYGLEELCYKKLIEEGCSIAVTMNACNEELKSRKDGLVYDEVNETNVHLYLKRLKKTIADQNKIKAKLDNIPDLLERLKENVTKFASLLDDRIENEEIKEMATVHEAMHKDIRLIAAIEGRLKTYITVESFSHTLLTVVNIIETDPELSGRDKKRLLFKIGASVNVDTNNKRDQNLDDLIDSNPRVDTTSEDPFGNLGGNGRN